ncbi:methylmalonyl-CoA mutase family protein [Tellurirhabdus bombi]|uniref:methylmalonyl-CoA mutase family protein n=1 Tax=Tellurirhabdus bombi TaxID=2907205 RepID=UPI001F2A8EBC|nr:methylmalonyl-CoA mutase family protein [Tellurirhabdus bombi]
MSSSIDSILSEAFSAADAAQWKQQIIADLKDREWDTLRWQTLEGFSLEPFYTATDVDATPPEHQRGLLTKQSPGWLTLPEISFDEAKATNRRLHEWFTKGADGALIDIRSNPDLSLTDLSHLLNGLKMSETPLWFRGNAQAGELAQALGLLLPYQLKGGIIDDAFAHWLQTGIKPDTALEAIAAATHQTLDSGQFRTATVSSHAFHNAGATATQELAFTLSALTDLYDYLTETGLTLKQLVPKTLVSLSVGTSYFMEIAKLRALRILLSRFIQAFNSPLDPTSFFMIHSQTSPFYEAAAIPYTNLLRATTETMSAVIGGCDAITVRPYDAVLGATSSFSDRIALNISTLLKEESYLNKVSDPAAGSYYLEHLTTQLVDKAWQLFRQVEQLGGLQQAVETGFVQEEINKAYEAKKEAIHQGKILVGVTKFRVDETPTIPSVKVPDPNESAAILPDRRLAEGFE